MQTADQSPPVGTRKVIESVRSGLLGRTALAVMVVGVVSLVPARVSNIAGALGYASTEDALMALGQSLPVVIPEGIAPTAFLRRQTSERLVVATMSPGVVSVPVLAAPAPAASPPTAGRPAPVSEEAMPADGRLLAEVARRQAELDRRARDLDLRGAQVRAAERLVRDQMAELARLRAEIEALVVRETEVAETDMEAAVGLYGNMRPDNAAKVFDKMEPRRAASILRRLGDRTAGPVLARMEPAAALAVTDEIVGRREAFRREVRP